MRSTLAFCSLVGLAIAAPRPQDIDFDLVNALPNPTYTIVPDATAQVVTYDAATILEAAAPQITSTIADIATDDGSSLVKRTACAPQPTGVAAYYVCNPDTAQNFASNSTFASIASSAPVPTGYTNTFTNLNASNNAYGYMGYTTLTSYSTTQCAAKCNAILGCMSFNLYFERDPTVDPGSGCDNPPSTTNIKCVFWGGPVNSANANNYGQWRDNFQVVIAGSNGYQNNSIATPPGYTLNSYGGNAAINAPYDVYGYNSYMGAAVFTSGPFNVSLCSDACSMKSAYALAHPPTDGSPVQTCQFFDTYILYVNNTKNPQGQYCAMYSETWSSTYLTNTGQYSGANYYFIEMSYTYSNSTSPGSANKNGAVYQASKDVSYHGLATYCSTLLGYTAPVTTTTVYTTVTPSVTVTAATVTDISDTTTVYVNGALTPIEERALSTPAALTIYPAAVISSACSLNATAVTTTCTIYSTVITTETTFTQTASLTATVTAETTATVSA